MHVALIGTYPPTVCGIATFTADVEASLKGEGHQVTVIPVARDGSDCPIALTRDERASYARAAERVNQSGFDVVIIEHEFGIFGGAAGSYIADFVEALQVPVVLTLHTVLARHTWRQRQVLRRLLRRVAAVTVFTATARTLLSDMRLVDPARIRVVPHGAPTEMYETRDPADVRRRFGIEDDRRVFSTFGLLSPGKGIELAIAALADVVAVEPRATYVVAGRTHPEVQRHSGEEYRARLNGLVDSLGLAENVLFLDRFLTVTELAEVLSITEVFCTPYVGCDQIVSGALTFALAAGCPVVSTPYRYAKDVLAGGAGKLVDFDDSGAFGAAMLELLEDGPAKSAARSAAQRLASEMAWPTVGKSIAGLLEEVRQPHSPITRRIDQSESPYRQLAAN